MLNTLFANDVRQTLDQFRRSVDQMFENFYGGAQSGATQSAGPASERKWAFSPTLESGWTENMLHLRAILPGVSENDVNVSVQNNQLMIEGERKLPEGFGFLVPASERRSLLACTFSHRKFLGKTAPGLLLSCREAEPGVWLSRNVQLHPSVRFFPPVVRPLGLFDAFNTLLNSGEYPFDEECRRWGVVPVGEDRWQSHLPHGESRGIPTLTDGLS